MKSNRRAAAPRPQLDLSLPKPTTVPAPDKPQPRRGSRPCSRERATWWFQQMRRVIEEGIEVEAPGVF